MLENDNVMSEGDSNDKNKSASEEELKQEIKKKLREKRRHRVTNKELREKLREFDEEAYAKNVSSKLIGNGDGQYVAYKLRHRNTSSEQFVIVSDLHKSLDSLGYVPRSCCSVLILAERFDEPDVVWVEGEFENITEDSDDCLLRAEWYPKRSGIPEDTRQQIRNEDGKRLKMKLVKRLASYYLNRGDSV
jgi:hypothetical protein